MSKPRRPNLQSFIDGPSAAEAALPETVAEAPVAVAQPEPMPQPAPEPEPVASAPKTAPANVVRMNEVKTRPAKDEKPAAMEQPTAKMRLVERTKQETVYLEPVVRDQLLELAFTERKKKHALMLEALDLLFKNRGLKSIKQLTGK